MANFDASTSDIGLDIDLIGFARLASAIVTFASPTEVRFFIPSTNETFAFTGVGLTVGPTGFTGGTINAVADFAPGGGLRFTLTGLSVPAFQLQNLIQAADVSGLFSLVFGGNDIFTGSPGADTLDGGPGADLLNGGTGSDTASYLTAASGVDARLIAGQGFGGDAAGDTYVFIENLSGSNFADVLQGNNAANVLLGQAGNDNLNGLGGNDTLNGGAGDDYLLGGAGADILIGGTGTDTASYLNASARVDARLIAGLGFAGDAAGDSFNGIENLDGSQFDDVLQGDNAANVLIGRGGNDNLNGLGGADTLFGGPGDDYLVGGAGADMLHGEAGTDTASYVNAGAGVDARLDAGQGFAGDALGDMYFGVENLAGSSFNDLLQGDGGANALSGLGGDDTLIGGAGADMLNGGAGTDTASYSNAPGGVDARLVHGRGFTGDASGDIFTGIENLTGSAFNDLLQGDSGANTLHGGGGADNVNGYLGNDMLFGDAGDDALFGHQGNDILIGGTGADLLDGGPGEDVAAYSDATAGVDARLVNGRGFGGDANGDRYVGIEHLAGSNFDDLLVGDAGANVLGGGAGNDSLNGQQGNDVLNGGAGDDVLLGGPGADVLNGGQGDDTAAYYNASSRVDARLNLGMGFAGDALGDTYSDIENLTGSVFDDLLVGNSGANTLRGAEGNDVILGLGGPDSLFGGLGDDTITVGDLSFQRIDGSDGIDRLGISASGVTLNLVNSGNLITGIEEIDLGNTNNVLELTGQALLALSNTSDTLTVFGGATDSVIARGTFAAQGQVVIGSLTFNRFVDAASAELLVESGVSVTTSRSILGPIVDLVDIEYGDGSLGVLLNGEPSNDMDGFASGWSVSSVGDFNGDGFDDVIIGAHGGFSTPSTYIVFGSATDIIGSGRGTDLSDIKSGDGSRGFAFVSRVESVSSAGDVNGDGLDDLIIGIPNRSVVIFGSATDITGGNGVLQLSDFTSGDGSLGFVLNGVSADDDAGWSVSSAGDINGDGLDDLIVGARRVDAGGLNSGASYVVFGSATDITGGDGEFELSDIATGDGSLGFVLNGVSANDLSGISVSSAGDVNGDGLDDLIVGASYDDPNGTDSGASFVVFGSATDITGGDGVFDLSDIETGDGTQGFVLNGVSSGDGSGRSVSSAGDFNGDGLDDLIVGAPFENNGASFVVFGSAADITGGDGVFELSDIETGDGSLGFVLNGAFTQDRAGFSVSSAGDVNGDGLDDIIIGAPSHPQQATQGKGGNSYLVFGSATDITGGDSVLNLSDIETGDGSLGFVLTGALPQDYSGFSVSSAGDVNGDGFDDLIIGAPGDDPNGNDFDDITSPRLFQDNSGASFIVFGGNFTASVTLLGTSGNDILNGTAANEIIVGAQGDDTISSGAGDDLLTGAEGDDLFVFSNGDGNDTIRDFGRGTDRIDVTDFGFANFASIQAAATDVGKDMVIALDADDSLTLLGVHISDLHAGDFLI